MLSVVYTEVGLIYIQCHYTYVVHMRNDQAPEILDTVSLCAQKVSANIHILEVSFAIYNTHIVWSAAATQ